MGIFLAFQYPIEIPGVSNEEFLRVAYNLKQKANGLIAKLSFAKYLIFYTKNYSG